MRVVVMGTGPFAVPMLRALLAAPRHPVAAVVVRPPRSGRGHRPPPPSPMRLAAAEAGLALLEPESINTPEARAALAALGPEILAVADYGQILRPETLAVARRGGVNLHGSLLPRYRGAAPVAWALYHGETETGVSVIHMTPELDAGPVLAQARTPIGPDETAGALEARLAELGGPLVVETLDALAAGTARPLPQDAGRATPARRLRKTDGELDWQRGARELALQVRAFEPWPRSATTWRRPGQPGVRLIVARAEALDEPTDAPPGSVLRADAGGFVVATGAGRLQLLAVQPAGKRAMTAEEFLRGHGVRPGDRLGPEPPADAAAQP